MNDEEIAPKARFQEEIEEKTLMDLDISHRLKKLMSALKQNPNNSQKNVEKTPKISLNSEKIRFDKNFKHFLKKKKFVFFVFFSIFFSIFFSS